MANLYLSPEPLTDVVAGSVIQLTGSEARHAATVSRVTVGDAITVGDGLGTILTGVVTASAAAAVAIEVGATGFTAPATPAVWLVQALAKGDRDELAIQAATELGVDGVIPWSAARSVSRWEGAKVAKGHERWSAIVREASKQSVRPWIPEVGPLVSTRQLAALATDFRLVVLDPLASASLSGLEVNPTPDAPARDLVIVVGPEGGIAPNELDQLYTAGGSGVRIGSTILRTSTAGPAALAVLSAKLGRWDSPAE